MASLNLSPNSNLQEALGEAKSGDEIILPAGWRFKAPDPYYPFTLYKKNQTPITIRSSRSDERTPNTEVTLADRGKLATLVGTGPSGALHAAAGSGLYRFIGIEFTNESDGSAGKHANQIIDLSNADYDPRNTASGFTFDWCIVSPQDGDKYDLFTRTATRGVHSNADNVWIKNSRITGFLGYYAHQNWTLIDSEAFLSTAGSSNSGIFNSTIEAYFNPLFLGGADTPTFNTAIVLESGDTWARLDNVDGLKPWMAITFPQPSGENANAYVRMIDPDTKKIGFTTLHRNGGGAVPPVVGSVCGWDGMLIKNFTLDRCRVKIPTLFAKTIHEERKKQDPNSDQNPKGYMEVKNVDGLTIKGCEFSGYPTTLALTQRNQGGAAPWSTNRNVLVESNVFKEASNVITLVLDDSYRLSTEGGNIKIRNNLILDCAEFMQTEGGDGWEASNNTILNKRGSSVIRGVTKAFRGGRLLNNIFQYNTYGLNCTIDNKKETCWPNLEEGGNIVIDNRPDKSGWIGNIFPNSHIADRVEFVLDANGKLLPNSPFKGKGSDGKDPGVDLEKLAAAMGPQVEQTPPPLPSPPVEVAIRVVTQMGINPLACTLRVTENGIDRSVDSVGQLSVKVKKGSQITIKPERTGYKFVPEFWSTPSAAESNVMFFAAADAVPPPQPKIRKVAWPTGETRQNEILAVQWKDGYRMKRHLTGAFAEFEKV
jgi:hypothetical protein